jgi:hypothetical protein
MNDGKAATHFLSIFVSFLPLSMRLLVVRLLATPNAPSVYADLTLLSSHHCVRRAPTPYPHVCMCNLFLQVLTSTETSMCFALTVLTGLIGTAKGMVNVGCVRRAMHSCARRKSAMVVRDSARFFVD